MVLCVRRGWQKQSLDQEPGLAEAPHPGTGTGPIMEAEFSPEATQSRVMLMTSHCLGEGLGSLLSCQGCREPGRPLGFSSSIPSPSLDVPLPQFFIARSRGVWSLTVAEEFITKTRIRAARVQVPAPSALLRDSGRGTTPPPAVSSAIQ